MMAGRHGHTGGMQADEGAMARALVLPSAAIEEVDDRFPAIAEHLAKWDASREANAVLRRLDVRIGPLLGWAENRGPATVTHAPRVSGVGAGAGGFRSSPRMLTSWRRQSGSRPTWSRGHDGRGFSR
jgi:hypothetical protein